MRTRPRGALLSVLAMVAVTRVSAAQTPCARAAEADEAEARAMQLNQSGDHDGAYAGFARSYELCQGARAQARMAIARMAAGRWQEADAWMRRALARRDDVWVETRRTSLEQQFAIIAQHVGEVVVTGEGGGAEVFINGQRVADFPMAAPVGVEPGAVTVRVNFPDGRRFERTEVVTAGQTTRVEVTWPQETVAPPRRDSTRLVLASVSAGVGAAALAVGAWATVERFDLRATYDARCPRGYDPGRGAECEALLAEAFDAPLVAAQVAGIALGSALVVTSVVLFVTAPSRLRTARAFACGPGPGTIGLGCAVEF